MQLEDACTELRYAKDWTVQTRQWYDRRLGQFIRWCTEQNVTSLEAIDLPLLRRYLEHLKTRRSERDPSKFLDSFTIHGHVRAIRTFLFWAADEELIDEKLPRKFKPPKREKKTIVVLKPQHIERLKAAALKTPTPLRDTALLILLLDAGVRANELCTLEIKNVFFERERTYIIVYGKGRKQRVVPIGKTARLALWRYIHRERKDTESERVFIGRKGPLDVEGLERLLYRLRDAAGAEYFVGVKVAPHRCRHTCAVNKLKHGQNLYAVQNDLGHSSISVTEGYLKGMTDMDILDMSVSPVDQMSKAS